MYDAPALRVIANPRGFPSLRWKGSNTAVRNGRVELVVYVRGPFLAAEPVDAAVAVRHRTAPASNAYRGTVVSFRMARCGARAGG
jgi:hypothetical protein